MKHSLGSLAQASKFIYQVWDLTEREMATSVVLAVEEIVRVPLGLFLYPPTE